MVPGMRTSNAPILTARDDGLFARLILAGSELPEHLAGGTEVWHLASLKVVSIEHNRLSAT
jgi:hypothetical protein